MTTYAHPLGCGCGAESPELQELRRFVRAMTGARGGHGGASRHRERAYRRWGGGFPFAEFGGGPPFGPGRKARRGDIRTAALLLLAEQPRNGYQIMQEVQERSEGVWRPSPGSVYPALAQLEDEGLIRSEEADGRKRYAITDEGRALLAQRDSDQPAPWEQMSGTISDEAMRAKHQIRNVAVAFAQVLQTGSNAHVAAAVRVMDRARRELYGILAEDDAEDTNVE